MRTKSSALRAKEEFLALYHDGKFEPGTRIPSESSMAEMLGVSRETWRKALGLLRGDGIVYSRHGSGTYLTEKRHRIANDLSQLKSLSRMIAVPDPQAETSAEQVRLADPQDKAQVGAPMPGMVSRVLVKEGDVVEQNQVLLIIEAMKMETSVVTRMAGRVDKLLVAENTAVKAGELLAVIK